MINKKYLGALLGMTVWVVSWMGDRYEERPCTDAERIEQSQEKCEDKVAEPMEKRFEDETEAREFVKEFLGETEVTVEEVTE